MGRYLPVKFARAEATLARRYEETTLNRTLLLFSQASYAQISVTAIEKRVQLKRIFSSVVMLSFLIGIPGLGFAQNANSGDIRGLVTDSSGAVVANAQVTVTNIDTGVTANFVTNHDGIYDTVSTLPGSYRINFVKEGFGAVLRGPITLGVGVITVDAQLSVGSTTQQVVVTAGASLLKTETSEQSTTLDAQTMVELPQVGQDWQNFTVLLPGASGLGTANPGIGVSVNGNLPYYSNFLSDGVSVVLPHSANLDTATLESLAEVEIDTSTFSAQYGIGGAVFNQITKSGTNSWHGAVYEYFQNDALNSRSYFNAPGQAIPLLRYNNYGGAIGGPILKNRMFFYFNLDRTSNHSQNSGFVSFPTADEKGGDFSAVLGGPVLGANNQPEINPCNGQVILQNQIFDQSTLTTINGQPCRLPFANNKITHIDPVANALQAYYPLPNRPGLTNNYYYLSPAISSAQRLFGKIDYDLSQKNRLTFTVVERNTNQPTQGEFPCPVNCQAEDFTDYSLRISDVWNPSSTLVNQFNYGFNRQGVWYIPDTLGLGIPQKVGLQYAKANLLPQITVNGTCCDTLTPNINAIYVQNVFEPSDVVTLVMGKHILHFGGELEVNQANVTPWGNVQAGQFTFSGVYSQATPGTNGNGLGYADFLLGNVQSWSANNQPLAGGRQKNPQIFVQDDIKLRSNFTLNLGLRYQIEHGWSEVHNRIGAFDPTINNTVSGNLGAMWFGGQNGRSQLQKNVYDIFLPRLGFSWSPRTNTVVRGGFGVYSYDWSLDNYGAGLGVGANSYGSATDQTNGLTPVVGLSGTGSNLPYLLASKSPTAYNGQSVNYTPYDTPVAKIYQWSFGVQRSLGHEMVAEIAYVASHATHMSFPVDINQIPEDKLGPNDNPTGRPYPQFQAISGDTYNSITNYNSLQVQAQKSLSSGWSFSANYTYSKFLSDQDSGGWGGKGGTESYQNSYDPGLNYSPSNLDTRHMLKGSAVYELPFGKGKAFLNKNLIADEIIGGWRLSSILVVESGNPFTITYSGTNLSYAQAGSWWPNLVGDPKVSHRSISGWYNPAAYRVADPGTFGNNGRNTLYGPGINVLNASLGKTFTLTERFKLQVRADAQNALNHPSFGAPDTNFNDPVDLTSNPGRPSGAGTISSTTVGGRTVQLSGRLSF